MMTHPCLSLAAISRVSLQFIYLFLRFYLFQRESVHEQSGGAEGAADSPLRREFGELNPSTPGL